MRPPAGGAATLPAVTVDRQTLDANKLAEISTAEESYNAGGAWLDHKPFPPVWGSSHFTKWSTISDALTRLGVEPGASVLDVGCGTGWTTAFLAESGWVPTGLDIAEARIASGRARLERWGLEGDWAVEDMDAFDLGREFDAALVYDALHHSARQEAVVRHIARHLRPGGWVLFGEPSLLHAVSPSARRVSRESGWIERGIGVRQLKRDCAAAGLGEFRRFHEPTAPFERSLGGLAGQVARLTLAVALFAPQHSIWLAARKPA